MGFFDDVLAKPVEQTGKSPHPSESRNDTVRRSRASILPGQLSLSLKLGTGKSACVALTGLRCWPKFAEMSITTYFPYSGQGPGLRQDLPLALHRFQVDAEHSLKLGVLFADGRCATNLDPIKWQSGASRDPAMDQPVLLLGGGVGRPGHTESLVEIFPLPPASPMTLIVEWPEEGIAETRTEIDGAAIRAAAASATDIWTDAL